MGCSVKGVLRCLIVVCIVLCFSEDYSNDSIIEGGENIRSEIRQALSGVKAAFSIPKIFAKQSTVEQGR